MQPSLLGFWFLLTACVVPRHHMLAVFMKKNGLSQFASLHKFPLRPTSCLPFMYATFQSVLQHIHIVTLSALPNIFFLLFLAPTAFFYRYAA